LHLLCSAAACPCASLSLYLIVTVCLFASGSIAVLLSCLSILVE
jgi:hypothetical protein